jgi:hypothetical protein
MSRVHRVIFRIHALFLGAMLVSVMFSMAKASVASRVESDVLRSTEILRPEVGDALYVRYRADFYAMTGRAGFEALKPKMDIEARRFGINLPIDQSGGD